MRAEQDSAHGRAPMPVAERIGHDTALLISGERHLDRRYCLLLPYDRRSA